MFKWKVGFAESINNAKTMMKRVLPLDIMKLTGVDLNKQFTVYPLCVGSHVEHSTREVVFKFYDSECKILHLTGKNSVHAISELLSELPPVYILHAELSLINERFTDLSCLNVLNTIYSIDIDKNGSKDIFWANLHKVVEEGLQFYWI